MSAPTSPRAFKDALGSFATGVTVVTTNDAEGAPVGITVSSFALVSLDPPLVLFNLGRGAFSRPAFEAAEGFAVNILAADQAPLSRRFAQALVDKWEGVAYETWDRGIPILTGCVASLECRTRDVFDGGDHLIFLGEVERLRVDRTATPLIYQRGSYGRFDASDHP